MASSSDVDAVNVQNSTGITPETLKATLKEKLQASHVDIEDMSGICSKSLKTTYLLILTSLGGCGQMFEAIIVSPAFEKKTTLARHRLVNTTLKEEIAAIHAWTPKCFTPDEWSKKQNPAQS